MTALSPEQALSEVAGAVSETPAGPRFEFLITGVVRRPSDVVLNEDEYIADVIYLGSRELYLTPAFHAAHFQQDVAGASVYDDPGISYLEVRAAEGVSTDTLRARISDVAPEAQVYYDESDDLRAGRLSDRAIGLQAMAVLAVGVVIGAAAGLLALLLTTRLVTDQLAGASILRAMGLRRGAIVASVVGTVCLATAIGVLGAVGIAIGLSPLSPVGLARRAEPDPGLAVPTGVLAAGAVAILVERGGRRRSHRTPSVSERGTRATAGTPHGLRTPGRHHQPARPRLRAPAVATAGRAAAHRRGHRAPGLPGRRGQPHLRVERGVTARRGLWLGVGCGRRQPERRRALRAAAQRRRRPPRRRRRHGRPRWLRGPSRTCRPHR